MTATTAAVLARRAPGAGASVVACVAASVTTTTKPTAIAITTIAFVRTALVCARRGDRHGDGEAQNCEQDCNRTAPQPSQAAASHQKLARH